MTFKQCVENFPLKDTLIGSYMMDSAFTAETLESSHYDPFWEDDTSFAFVIFSPETEKYECWSFCFNRVSGYINETDDYDNFYPATFIDDFGWEKVDPWAPYFEDQITLPDDELADELGWPLEECSRDKWRREQVAYLFDTESYTNGLTFTSMDSLKKFLNERRK